MTISDRVRVKDVRVLSKEHYVLKTTTFDYRRADGEWQTQHRETYDRGNGAALLPYNLAQRRVVLVLPIEQALAMIADGRIQDAKTIMLLQYAALKIFV